MREPIQANHPDVPIRPYLDRSPHLAAGDNKRFLLEGVVIVGSILLAFAIDAAWDGLQESERREQLTTSLLADVEETRGVVERRREEATEVIEKARRILQGVASGVSGDDLDSLVVTVGDVFLKGYWVPINHTYEQALGSGDLALIEDAQTRSLLGRYSGSLASMTHLQQSVVTQYYGELEPFMVAHTDYADIAWTGGTEALVQVPFTTNYGELASRRDFANLINLKLELELEVIEALRIAQETSDRLLERLR